MARNISGPFTNVTRELPELASRLESSYPGVRIVWAFIMNHGDDKWQQTIRYQAPLAVFKQHGLVNERMLSAMKKDRAHGTTECGDDFSLYGGGFDCESSPGSLELCIRTRSYTQDERSVSTKKLQRIAAKLLRSIAAVA